MALAAQKLFLSRPEKLRLSPFVFMTDPQRVPDPVAAAQKLPKGSAIIFRHFGAAGHKQTAENLRQITIDRDQQFLLGDDPELAVKVGADGVHFRRDAELRAAALWRKRCPEMLITMAGLKGAQDYKAPLSILDGLFISSVFYSKSPSAGDPIGEDKLTEICRALNVPVFALGGVSARTVERLTGTGAAGLAGIAGLRC